MKDRARRAASQPLLWLVLQAAALAALLRLAGVYGLSFTEDSADYVALSEKPLPELLRASLAGMRGAGYPLFLKAARAVSPELEALPLLQLALHGLAVCVFCLGLRRIGFAPGLALAVASPLLYANTILIDGCQVMAESVALSLAVCSLGALLLAVGRPGSRGAWAALAAGAFAAWQARPVYQFLVLLLPLLGGLLAALARPRIGRVLSPGALAARLLAASALPWLAFCALRWLALGHFGAVSFAGVSLAGVTAPLLDDELVAELPAAQQPLARAVLERLPQQAPREVSDYGDYDRSRLTPGHPGGVLFALRAALAASDAAYRRQDQAIWDAALPAVVAELGVRSEVAADAALAELSRAILRARPAAYARRVGTSFAHGALLMLANGYAFWAALALLLGLALTRHAAFLVRCLRTGFASAEVASRPRRGRRLELEVALLLAAGFALAQLGAVACLSAPTLRFADAAGALLPLPLLVLACGLGEGVGPARPRV